MFLLDTPGVLAPRIPSVETGLKLALCGEPDPHPPQQAPRSPGWAACAWPGCSQLTLLAPSEPVGPPGPLWRGRPPPT